MKAAIYVRASLDRQKKERSVESQENACREVCKSMGWDVAAIYRDNNRSASRYARRTREEFQRLIDDIAQYDVILTWEASRAARDLGVYARLREECRKHGVKWFYSGKLIDFSRTDDAFSSGLDILVAERESSQTSERVQRGMKSGAEKGRPHGRLPYGYIREYDQNTGALLRQVPHPQEGPVITEAAERILDGETAYSIVKDFQARGLPLRGEERMQPNMLVRLLKNPTYAGKRVYRGEVFGDADWPPLIPAEKWEALQAILNDPARNKRQPSPRGSEPVHLLSGIARCGICGSVMHRIVHHRKYESYYCKAKGCTSINKQHLDDLITQVVRARLSQPDALEAVNNRKDPDVGPVVAQIRELELRLEALYEQAANGEITPAGLAKVEAKVLGKLQEERARLAGMGSVARPVITDPHALADGWEQLPLDKKRDTIRALMELQIVRASVPGRTVFEPERAKITWI